MKHPAAAPDVLDGARQRRVLSERAVRNRSVDQRHALGNDASAAEVHMADFAVAHDAFGEPDGLARSLQQRMRIALEQRIPMRKPGGSDGISIRLAAISPSVKNGENHRPVEHARRLYEPRSAGRTALRISCANPLGSSDAPPTRPPSMFGFAEYDATFSVFMLPP